MEGVAYLTAEQLGHQHPEACAPGRPGRCYVPNDDGSNVVLCAISRRRIDPATGQCGYHDTRTTDRLPWLLARYDDSYVRVVVPAPPYPLLHAHPTTQEDAP
jgi:hypothetical protein